MSTYSASVKALLTLDATKFDEGITKALNSVEKLVTGFNSIKKNSSGLVEGLRLLRDNMNTLSESVNRLKVSMEQAKVFNTVATAIQKVVTSARQLSEANISLSGMYQNLQNVVTLFANALSQTEIKLKGNVSIMRQLSEATSSANNQIRVAGNGYSNYLAKINQVNQALSRIPVTLNQSNASISNATSNLGRLFSTMQNSTRAFQIASKEILAFGNIVKLTMTETASSMKYLQWAMQNFGTSATTQLGNIANSTASSLRNMTANTEGLNASLRATQMATNLTSNGFTNITNSAQGMSYTVNGASNSTKNVSQNLKDASSSTNTFNQGLRTASNNSNNFKQKLGGLTQSLGMLRSMVSMVGSMFLYNFAHNMMISVQNTVKAKSEMLSFLHTMGMTGSQINSFNSALDRTAERFQRINKYNIGETVANIGLEFNLSAKEMEKAMSVTSMVTSEYLRAGRNADEAALAVKDIMQGQFQRLSRETGVKGEQLKEAGWSGDVNDVMGLMDALEKVAKARHWDVFAEKASSLNDILLITQNRFSEWATDVSEGFVPIVTGSFNALINVIDKVTAFFSGLGQSLHLPDWTGTALMVGGLTVAIGTLVTTSIMWRTNMGLLQIAQQGLRNSILATVFGIKAEEMANAKASTVLKAKILGVETETMANNGLLNTIKAKIVGLNAETVAEKGVGKAVEEAITKKNLEKMANKEVSASNVSLLSSYVALQRQLPLTAVEGLKWHQKLALLNKETTVAKAQNMNFLQSLRAMITGLNATKVATTALTASIVALAAVAVGGYVIATMNSTKTMKEFNDMAQNGEEKIRKIKNAMGESSEEAKNMTEAVERVRSALSKFETRKMEASERAGRTVAKYLEEAQVDEGKIKEITNSALRDANAGVSIVAKTGDEIEKTYRGAANSIGLMKGKLSKEEMEQYANDMLTSADRIAKAQEKMMMSDSAIDRAFGWFDFSVEQVGHWWNEFSTNLGHQDWGAAWENIWKGFMRGFGNLPIASDIWKTLSGALFGDSLSEFKGSGDLVGAISKILGMVGDGWTGVMDELFSAIMPFDDIASLGEDLMNAFGGLGDWIMKGIGNLFGGGEGGTTGGLLAKKINPMGLLKNIFGAIDSSGVGEWFNNTIVTPFTEFFTSFSLDDLFATLTGGSLFSEGGGIIGKLLGWDENTNIGEMLSLQLDLAVQSITNFANVLLNQFMMLPMNIATFLTQIITNITSFASQLLSQGIQAGSNFLNGVVTHISQLPGRVYSFITTTAHNIISGASQWVSNARSKATETVNAVITQVSQLPNKVYNEFMKIAQRIRDAISGAVQAATQFGSDVVNAVLNALHIHSPGIIQEKIATEFANIGGRIAENIPNASQQAETFGQGIVDGMGTQLPIVQQQAQAITDAMNVSANSQAIDFSGQFVGDYQADANTITGLNQVMTTDTAMTFGLMGDTVNGTINGISMNLQTSYLNMNTAQTTALTTMQNQNKTAYTNLQNQTTSSLNNMRSTTQNVTMQMTNAWNHMKDNIIASANQLKTQSTAHFNTLSNHIGSFYRKLQNPSMWGGGDDVPTRHYNSSRGKRGIQAVRQTFGITPPRKGVAGSPDLDNLPKYMKLKQLRAMMGGSSASIFDGMDLNREVNVQEFLSQFEGGFGWNDWHPTHFGKIKNTSGEWKMRGPQIMHRIDTGESFQVKEFYNSQPQISFSSFQHMAEALFSAIPYEFYYNSDAHGSWQGALQAGSCNCYDGANALIALAATCGFSGHMEHGTWNGIPHVYAVINGKKMDTTGWQNRRDWNGVSAGSPPNYKPTSSGDKVTNVNIDMSGTTFYGMDDFEGRMEEIAQRVLGEEVNTSITLGI